MKGIDRCLGGRAERVSGNRQFFGEFAGAEKSLLESQNEFSKHVSTYS